MMYKSLLLLLLSQIVLGQPVDTDTEFSDAYKRDYVFTSFQFLPNPEPTYASSNQKPTTTDYYAPPYSEVSHLVPDLSTTTWGSYNPNATAAATDTGDPYGQYAWTQLWASANPPNFTETGLYTTTVQPTAVPTESLIRPPQDAFHFDKNLTFPKDFIFGVAGSAAQIEGAVAQEGRSPSLQEKLISDSRPKDYVTDENYYLYKQDIVRLAAIGVKYYSFTIPWSRILPFVTPDSPVNKQAIDHYDDLINFCLENGVKPIVTLTHFDSPLEFMHGKNITGDYPLMNYGGYSESYKNFSFEDAFVHYGKVLLIHFADRVPVWVGYNEPIFYSGYPSGVKVVIKSTAKLHNFYHEDLGGKGKFGIKLNVNFGVPFDSENDSDVEAAKRFNAFYMESFGNPLFLGEDYPDSWKATFANYSDFSFTQEELQEVKNGSDFLGIDPYTYTVISSPSGGIEACQNDPTHELWPFCVNQTQTTREGWKIGYRSQSYVYITPVQLREFLSYLWNTFRSPIFIGEFGFPEYGQGERELGDQLYDLNRSIYYRSFLDAILKSIHLDNTNVMGATAWSFVDNWEFGDKDSLFGLQVVNTTTQERYYKKSFFDTLQYVEERSE